MKWGNLLWSLQQLTPAQLDEPALVYHPHFGRLYPVAAIDNLRNLAQDKNIDPLALAIEKAPIHD